MGNTGPKIPLPVSRPQSRGSPLVRHRLIEIGSNSSNDVGEELLAPMEKGIYKSGYDVANMLRSIGEKNSFVRITQNFSELQELIGFSITDLVEVAKGETIR